MIGDALSGLNAAQREAVEATRGPVAILAGAGTGKTRVISHRVAHAVATSAVDPNRVLLVTFTEKAAREMVERVRQLGLPSVAARTFHAAALAQLRYYWPLRHEGAPLPELLSDKFRIVAPLARRLPGGYRYTPAKDLIDEIEWAKSRRISPDDYPRAAARRSPPTSVDLFARLYSDYERAKARQGLIDFDDLLLLTVELLETDEEAARQVRGRYSWFSVDEYQDTSPLQQRLLDLWLGDRRDLCVVGDEDQTIYTFAGATPEYLTGFARRFPEARVISLLENYRSTPQVLALANRLIASTGRDKRLTATRPPGPEPSIRSFVDDEAELSGIVARVRALMGDGVRANQIAVLVRLNAQIAPIEAALTRAGLPYQVRGQRFFERRDVRSAVEALKRVPDALRGEELLGAIESVWRERLGFEAGAEPEGSEARERQAALSTLLSIVGSMVEAQESADREGVEWQLAVRAADERAGSSDGVELLTLHRAKGLEWDAVFLPSLEEGLLPVAQAKEDGALLDEERRLLYVGLTRARVNLALSWAQERRSAQGKSQHRRVSRFVRDLMPAAGRGSAARKVTAAGSGPAPVNRTRQERPPAGASDDPTMAALRAWRLARARTDGMAPYVIAHDATLAAIVQRSPRSLAELARVPGIGPAKLDRYGLEILETLERDGLTEAI